MNTDTPFFNPLHTADSSCRTQMEQSKPKIPRPLNCFMVFRLEKQREIVRRCPGANHRDISKIISKWWKELSAEDKKPYIAEADRRKIKHREMHPNYKFSPKRKNGQTRPYKKRAQNEFSARDFENKMNLYAMYQSKPLGLSELPSSPASDSLDDSQQDNNKHSLLYLMDKKTACNKKNNNKAVGYDETINYENKRDTYIYPPSPYHCVSPGALQLDHDTINSNYNDTVHFNTCMLYPTIQYDSPASSVCYPMSSQHCSPATSHDIDSPPDVDCSGRFEPFVNYNIYNSYYGSGDVYTSCHPLILGENGTLHYVSPSPSSNGDRYSANTTSPSSHTIPTYYPALHMDSNTPKLSHSTVMAPTLLTQPFLYHP